MSDSFRQIVLRHRDELIKNRLVKEIDLHFAEYITDLDNGGDELFLASLCACRSVMNNHTCCDLRQIAGRRLFPGMGITVSEELNEVVLPKLGDWNQILQNYKVVGKPGFYRPLVLDDVGRLYLHRYWEQENYIASEIQRKSSQKIVLPENAKAILDSLFGNGEKPDWQKIAAFTALQNRFCVISGGPGTGKTTTVAKVLAALQMLHEKKPLRIALTAPTGKAAARLQESIVNAKKNLSVEDKVIAEIPEETFTLHRLLGYIPNSSKFKHNGDNPLEYDLVLVDEASMVSLSMYDALFKALKPECRLVLLGDRNQLTSVESGAVLADLCTVKPEINAFSADFVKLYKTMFSESLPKAKVTTPLDDAVIELQKSYRFGAIPGIGALANGSNKADNFIDAADILMLFDEFSETRRSVLPANSTGLKRYLKDFLENFSAYYDYFEAVGKSEPEAAFKAFSKQIFLCATRRGDFGVDNLNYQFEKVLQGRGVISSVRQSFYPGRPIMVTENAYDMELFNGDIGLTMPNENGELRVYFQTESGFRAVPPSRLPAHETVYAMTIHKSQGSEFEHPVIILPAKISPVITKELIYTGITRAKKEVTMWFEDSVFISGVIQRVQRESGLVDQIL